MAIAIFAHFDVLPHSGVTSGSQIRGFPAVSERAGPARNGGPEWSPNAKILAARQGFGLRNGKRAPVQIDRRFAIGRRIDLLATTFRERVGLDEADPDPVLLAAVEKAARLTALAEDAAARATRGDPKVTLDDVVRLTRLADVSVRRLHLDRRNATQQPKLSDYLAARGGEP